MRAHRVVILQVTFEDMAQVLLAHDVVEEYHPSQSRHGGRCSMTYILIVAGTGLVLFASALLIIERENAAT